MRISTVALVIPLFATLSLSRPMHSRPKLKRERRKREEGEPPAHEDEISFSEFQSMHDEGNWADTFRIFELTDKYFYDRNKNISKNLFMSMCREYIVHDLIESRFNLTFITIAELNKLMQHVIFRDHFTDITKKEMSFKEMYYYTIGGRLLHMLTRRVSFEDLPLEFQSKIKEAHEDVPEHDFEMMFNYGRRARNRIDTANNVTKLKHKELKRKFKERYGGIEWKLDGRRVIDEDYDALEPAFERNVHNYRVKKEELNDDEIDMLLDEDL